MDPRPPLYPVLAVALLLIAAGCGAVQTALSPGASATATAGMTTTATARTTETPGATPSASATAAAIDLYVRSWTVNGSIGPVNNFGNVPLVVADGRLMSVRYTTTASPFPLYTAPTARALTAAGLAMIVTEARADGLLGTVTEFECPGDQPGSVDGGPGPQYLDVSVNGEDHQLRAVCVIVPPSVAPGTPAPGTWAAFRRFRSLLIDPSPWLGAEVGPPQVYDPDRLAVLVLPLDPAEATPAPADLVAWPLAARFAAFGVPYADGRCSVVSGSDAALLLAAAKPVAAPTVFGDAGGALARLIIRPFMPGEPDPCTGD